MPSSLELETSKVVIVALGSNLGHSDAHLAEACTALEKVFGPIITSFPWSRTKAWVHPDDPAETHPDYLNGVAIFHSEDAPEVILEQLLSIELAMGRKRDPSAPPWQPRLIDLDLIAAGQAILETERLILPHPRMHERPFVLGPLCKIMPNWEHPVLGKTAADLLQGLES